MILVFTGKGKGKTSAALGVGLRAVGAGKRVLMVQFLKEGKSSEHESIDKLDDFQIKSFGKEGFFLPQSQLEEETEEKGFQALGPENKKEASKGLEFARDQEDSYNLIILDEINLALDYDLLPEDQVLEFARNSSSEIILTGRNCPDSIIEEADLVSNIQEVKHYYQQGHKPIKGIDL